jgi:hypothetical protein
LQQLAYFASIYSKADKFTLSIQGRSITVLTAEAKVAAVKLKLKVFVTECAKSKFDFFDTKS